jgi:hypothetical protein
MRLAAWRQRPGCLWASAGAVGGLIVLAAVLPYRNLARPEPLVSAAPAVTSAPGPATVAAMVEPPDADRNSCAGCADGGGGPIGVGSRSRSTAQRVTVCLRAPSTTARSDLREAKSHRPDGPLTDGRMRFYGALGRSAGWAAADFCARPSRRVALRRPPSSFELAKRCDLHVAARERGVLSIDWDDGSHSPPRVAPHAVR